MKRFLFFLFTIVFLHLSGAGTSLAQSFVALPLAVKGAISLLENEIERDQEITSFPLNIARIRMARKSIATGLTGKKALIDSFARFKAPRLGEAISVLTETLEAEKSIVGSARVIDSIRIRTRRTIIGNIKLKKEALARFQKWFTAKRKH